MFKKLIYFFFYETYMHLFLDVFYFVQFDSKCTQTHKYSMQDLTDSR